MFAQPIDNMVFVQPGTFTMGSATNSLDSETDEIPRTTVTLPFGYWMGIHEVSQQDYVDVTGLTNPSYHRVDAARPVELVSWRDATNFCAMLTGRER